MVFTVHCVYFGKKYDDADDLMLAFFYFLLGLHKTLTIVKIA